MACRIYFQKALLFVLNALLAFLGVGLIALSVYELNSSMPGTFEHIAIVVQIFVGSFVVLTSFLGCVATGRISLGLIWSYVICILILLCLQIYIIAAAHTADYVQNARNEFIMLWSNLARNGVRIASTEQKYTCCGKDGSQDYILMGTSIPKSCYLNLDRISSHLYSEGCLDAIQAHVTDSGVNGLIVKWTLFINEMLSLGAALSLAITIRNKLRREKF